MSEPFEFVCRCSRDRGEYVCGLCASDDLDHLIAENAELQAEIAKRRGGATGSDSDRLFAADDLLSRLDEIAEAYHEGEYRLPIHDDNARKKMLAAINDALGLTHTTGGK